MNSIKIILIILDGLGGRPVKELGGLTPLQHASTPVLDGLARRGSCGVMDVAPVAGFPLGSDVAHLSIFGYDMNKDYPGRGPLEALGVDLDLSLDDVALRGNFAFVDENMIILDHRAGRDIPEAEDFIDLISPMHVDSYPDVTIEFKHSTEQRVACVIRGENLSPNVSATNPNKNGVPVLRCVALDGSDASQKTAGIINEITRKIHEKLKDTELNHVRRDNSLPEVNAIIFHGAGQIKKIRTLKEKHRITAACVTGNGLIKGFCRFVGIDLLPCRGATGRLDTNLHAKFDTISAALADYELLFLHIKATDSTGHDKKPLLKSQFIEMFDKELGRFINGLDSNTYLIVTGDHSTPCILGDHSGDPVPVLMHGNDVFEDHVKKFDEISCASGYFSRINASYFLNIILNKLNKLSKFGA
ncbi:MAG: 2,3-bisphosphoglycerate-independent phosphoglycerate mutase [Promethearchaeota archaeon]